MEFILKDCLESKVLNYKNRNYTKLLKINLKLDNKLQKLCYRNLNN